MPFAEQGLKNAVWLCDVDTLLAEKADITNVHWGYQMVYFEFQNHISIYFNIILCNIIDNVRFVNAWTTSHQRCLTKFPQFSVIVIYPDQHLHSKNKSHATIHHQT